MSLIFINTPINNFFSKIVLKASKNGRTEIVQSLLYRSRTDDNNGTFVYRTEDLDYQKQTALHLGKIR